MVLKFSNCDKNTGNTVRKKYHRMQFKTCTGKGAKISNLKYYSHPPDFNALLERIEDKIYESDLRGCGDLYTVKELLEYFINLNDDINEGYFQRDYVPCSCLDLVDEMVNSIQELLRYEARIQNGDLDLGLDTQNGISITLSVSDYGELSKFGQRVYHFDTNKSYERIRRDYQKEQKWKLKDVAYHKRTSNRHGVQRKYELEAKKIINKEPDFDDDFVYPMSEEISITVIRAHPTDEMHDALRWSSKVKPEKALKGTKSLKKSAHEKVRNWGYHHNISRSEIEEMIHIYHGINSQYLQKIEKRQKMRRRHFKRYKSRHPEMVHLQIPEPKYPVGLWPDDVARILAEYDKQVKKLQLAYTISIKKAKAMKKKKRKPGKGNAKRTGETFLTHVSFVDDYKYIDGKAKKAEEEVIVRPEPLERITRTLEPWEFVDEVLHHSEPDMKVVFRNCELPELGNLTLSPPPPSLKPSLKERRSSAASSEAGDFQLLELPFVTEEEKAIKAVSEISSQAHGEDGTERSHEENYGKVHQRHKKSNKTNGRKRKKLKQKREALLRTRTVSFTTEMAPEKEREKMTSGASGEKGPQREKGKGQKESDEKKEGVTLSRQVSIHTKDNTQQFVESLSDMRYEAIQLKVKSSNLRPSYLVRKFGTDYQEASTYPRVLRIDVTDRVLDVVKLFRKTEAPFGKPLATLIFKPSHGSGEEIAATEDNLKCTLVSLYIKADMELNSFEDLYLRMKDKLKYNLIYPVTNIVEDFVQIFKLLPYTSYLQPQIIPSPLPKVDERTRSQLDWLYTLCHWKFDIYQAEEAYALFQKSFQVHSMARPNTASLCRLIDQTPRLALRSCDMPTCYNSPILQLLSCQHALCNKCFQTNILQDLSRKKVPFTCWVPGCGTVLDPVCLQLMLSLPLFKLHQVYLEDLRIKSHPLWQWCPKQGCGRVVKLSGAGFLDNGVVIMCDCGTSWCFHCRSEGHWPASCEQAKNYFNLRENDYKDFKETKNVISGFCPIVRVLCAQCSKPNFESSNPPLARDATSTAPQMAGNLNPKSPHTSGIPQSGEDSGLDSGFCSEDGSVGCPRCECTYEVCRRCVQTLDSTISVPEAILQADEGISPSSSQPLLLPLLFYHTALAHHQEKQLWSWASVEIRTGKILQQLKKSKTRIVSSSPTSMRSLGTDGRTSKNITPFSHHGGYRDSPQSGLTNVVTGMHNTTALISENTLVHLPKKMSVSNRPRTSHVSLSPTMETEKFFLVLVQQFIQQSHVLLEYVYVYLMDSQSAKKTPEIVPLVISLEAIVKQIQQLLSSMNFTSASTVGKLHKLHDAGNKLVVSITTTFKNTNVNSLASRDATFCKSSYNKLPPIGHKYTKVKFMEPRIDRNITLI